MSIKISVEPQQIEQSSNRMEEQCITYEKAYRELYQCVENMQNVWKGKDNLAFVNQIEGFQGDFVMMLRLMRQYIEFLRNSAASYRNAQEDRVAKARALTN